MNPKLFAIIFACLIQFRASIAQEIPTTPVQSQGLYRLAYTDGTTVRIFDDFTTHRPKGGIDIFAIEGHKPYRVVAAAAGRIMAIKDGYSEQQSGRAAANCHNNYIWIAHANGEWTNYSHLAYESVTNGAKRRVGEVVEAGAYLGDEGAVGCALLEHLHFEVAVPDSQTPIDSGGFLTDNDAGKRARNPRFCGVVGGIVVKDAIYHAISC